MKSDGAEGLHHAKYLSGDRSKYMGNERHRG